jgi:AcrR family transcriptional regulator
MATSEAAGPARVRMERAARKALLLGAAREVFAARGYAASGLAEIADRAGVDKRLLYYYFPDGRPELFAAVTHELTDELLATIRAAVVAPVGPTRKVERLVAALLAFFEAEPDAFNILFRDPFGVRDEAVVRDAAGLQVDLAKELSSLLAPSGLPTGTLLAVTLGSVAYVIRVIEMAVAGQVAVDDAVVSVTRRDDPARRARRGRSRRTAVPRRCPVDGASTTRPGAGRGGRGGWRSTPDR